MRSYTAVVERDPADHQADHATRATVLERLERLLHRAAHGGRVGRLEPLEQPLPRRARVPQHQLEPGEAETLERIFTRLGGRLEGLC